MSKGLPPDGKLPGRGSRPRPAKDFDGATEPDLIDAALKRDIEAFAHLFERYRPDLYGLCLRRLKDSSLAEDVVQDVFIRAFKNLPSFDHTKPFWPWLATIAVRMCIDLQRHRSLTHYSEDIGVSLDAAGLGDSKTALDETIASEERAQLHGWLSTLPKRQRRALLLHVWDGWSYAEIAAAEGISVGAVELLIVRARKKMRSAYQSRPLPAIVFPFTWLRWKLQRIEERIRLLGFHGEGLANTCMQATCLSTLAMIAVGASHPTGSLQPADQMRSDEVVLSAAQFSKAPTPLSNAIVTTKASDDYSQQSFSEVVGSLPDRMINPNQNATPENGCCYSMAASPDYENNHTILASGSYLYRHALFVSQDGGASWKARVSLVPLGYLYDSVFSPEFLKDRRVFTIGELGLHQSDDGGEVFRTVSSTLFGWSIAISPSFGRQDSKVWIGGKTLLEYDATTGVTQPGALTMPASLRGYYPSITFSPGYSSDHTVFVSDDYSDGETILYRCQAAVCDETRVPIRGPLKLRLSPRFHYDGLAYAFTSSTLLVSNDGAKTFREIQFSPLPQWGFIADVAVSWNRSSDPAIFVSVGGPEPGIYRSLEAGYSWNKVSGHSPAKLIVTPTGRLVAAGILRGIACSDDGGVSWTRPCPPE